jgi:hypothetical protein
VCGCASIDGAAVPPGRKLMAVWTAELDRHLLELHGRKLDLKFISSWLRRPRADIVSRLAELGVSTRRAPSGATAIPRRPAHRPSAQAAPPPADVPHLPVHPPVAERREPTSDDAAPSRNPCLDELASASRQAMDRSDDDDDADHVPAAPGCPPGHLMPEAHIRALYHALSRKYG